MSMRNCRLVVRGFFSNLFWILPKAVRVNESQLVEHDTSKDTTYMLDLPLFSSELRFYEAFVVLLMLLLEFFFIATGLLNFNLNLMCEC